MAGFSRCLLSLVVVGLGRIVVASQGSPAMALQFLPYIGRVSDAAEKPAVWAISAAACRKPGLPLIMAHNNGPWPTLTSSVRKRTPDDAQDKP